MCIYVCVCCCYSVAKSRLTLCNPMNCSTSVFRVLHYLPEFVQTHVHSESVMPSNHPSSVVPLLSSCIQTFPASGSFLMSQLFASVGQSTGASASTPSPPNEYLGLVFCKTDWLDLLAVQGTSKSLLQHHSSKASILRCSAFFMVQLWGWGGKPQIF